MGLKYTFREISNSIDLKFEMLEKIHRKPDEQRTLVENQLLEIFFNATHFKSLKSGLLCLTPIIPIYNSEKYLPECLESICQQIKQNVEVILINDCSTDRSAKICKKYAKKFSFIK